jgi:hypothetical protein
MGSSGGDRLATYIATAMTKQSTSPKPKAKEKAKPSARVEAPSVVPRNNDRLLAEKADAIKAFREYLNSQESERDKTARLRALRLAAERKA